MRVLPTTRRGIWVLAVAVWLMGCAVVWAVLPVRPRVALHGDGYLAPKVLTADGRLFAAIHLQGRPNFRVAEWDVTTRRFVGAILPDEVGWGAGFDIDPTGRWLAVGGSDGCEYGFDVWEVATRKHWARFRPSGEDGRQRMHSFFPDGNRLAFVEWDRSASRLVVWDVPHRREQVSFPDAREPVAIAPDGRHVAAVQLPTADDRKSTSRIVVLDTDRSGARVECAVIDGQSRVTDLSFAGDRLTATICTQSGIHRPLAIFPAEREFFWESIESDAAGREIRYYPHAERFGTAGTERIWMVQRALNEWYLIVRDRASHRILARCEIGPLFPTGFHTQLSPDQQTLAVGNPAPIFPDLAPWQQTLVRLGVRPSIFTSTGDITFLDTLTGRELGQLCEGVGNGQFSSDGSMYVTGGDGTMKIWDLPPRKPFAWLAVAAGVWALPVAWLTHRRVRRP